MPDRIGRYRIEAELGSGAMGRVFRAHDPDIDRMVAIKLVRADLLTGEARADYLRRFRQEAQAAARCTHPNIVAIFDYATHDDGNPFLAMEYVPGRPLRQPGRAIERLAPGPCTAIALQLLDALAAAHAVGVVHRDIKPANLLLLPDGRLKVTDFGISRLDTSELTAVGDVVGTPSYMSPEQCRGDPVDARTDLFSTGTVLFELLSGVRPFAAGDATGTIRRLLDDNPADLSALPGDVPAPLRAAIARALAKSPADRFASAADMAQALRAATAGSDVTVVLPTPTSPQTPPAPPLPPEVLARLEASLASAIGPIARHVLRDAAAKAHTPEELGRLAAASIDDQTIRARFLRDLGAVTGDASASSRTGGIEAGDLDPIERELTRILGPIARVLVRRAAPAAASPDALRDALAVHIESPADRSTFLGRKAGGSAPGPR